MNGADDKKTEDDEEKEEEDFNKTHLVLATNIVAFFVASIAVAILIVLCGLFICGW